MQSRWSGIYSGGNSVVHAAAYIAGHEGEYEYDTILSVTYPIVIMLTPIC